MDILNKLSARRFAEADDFLTYISIYEDHEREKAYKRLLKANQKLIKGSVCVEAGSGLGIMSEYLVQLGAKKVIAVEVNPHMAALTRERLKKYPQAEVVHSDIQSFRPDTKIDVLVHEFYGQLLYDEELLLLNQLKFKPNYVLPNGGALMGGVTSLKKMKDPVITSEALTQLKGVLVSGLFGAIPPLQFEIVRFDFGKKSSLKKVIDLQNRKGDLLYMGLQIEHNNKKVCQAGICDNWAYAWTPRTGNQFEVAFPGRYQRMVEPTFRWLD